MGLSAIDQAKKLHAGEITSVELTQLSLDTIDKTDGDINAYISVTADLALHKAKEVDKRIQAGDIQSSLAGVPIGIKDNLCLKNTKTTCASKMLENFEAPYTATAVKHILDADLIPVGKCNLDEFAMGSSTEHSAFGATKNPNNIGYVPGGSSGGSAATVAARQVALSLGSDTGGSIRQPAAYCGVVGLKPTYGRISRYGLVAFASSLDQIGPFSHTVEDTAHLLTILSGHDTHDATSLQCDVPDFSQALVNDVKGVRIAVPEELFGDTIDDAVSDSVKQALDLYVSLGATYDVVSMESFKAALACYYIIAPAEASANLARFDGVRYTHRTQEADTLKEMIIKSRSEGFGDEVQRRILMGTFVLSSGYYDAYYGKALKARQVIKQDFDRVFNDYDVILSPTTPSPAFKFGAHTNNPLQMYLNDIATIPANMAGLPAMSIPCGFSEGLPIGMQFVGKVLDEAMLLRMGYTYQQHTSFHLQEGNS
ncbi:Asp-tRNA(Asn)/Glu-tRNA(Gln) amidotransferase GatCAB subunit A [bacterium]|nr:Asp-tRNA(Asn)/Glu-tRNA(Gln) amidotransferase GatCAB subunit A [bacterium]